MHPVLVIAGFSLAMAVLNRWLRSHEADGHYQPLPSHAARPGLRVFFDYGDKGWTRSGIDQRPSPS